MPRDRDDAKEIIKCLGEMEITALALAAQLEALTKAMQLIAENASLASTSRGLEDEG